VPKRKPARRNVRLLPAPIPDSSSSPTASTPRSELAIDEALTLFLRRPPHEADRLIITAHGSASPQSIVQDVAASDVREAGNFANAVIGLCERWAVAEGRETRFLACWTIGGQRVLASYQWACGDGRPPLDGTGVSLLAQQQQHAEVQHRLYHEGYSLVTEGWKALLQTFQTRILALEKENHELRDRLHKAGDVDAEIAIQSAAADLETRARTSALLEERLLPIVEAFAVKALQERAGLGAAAAAAPEHPKQKANATEREPS
jgi:hypothetical protein